jgi:hypothetical protein
MLHYTDSVTAEGRSKTEQQSPSPKIMRESGLAEVDLNVFVLA